MALSFIDRRVALAKPTALVHGTLDLLIPHRLALQPMHGWGISPRSRQISNDVLEVNQGVLHSALRRLEQRGWIRSGGGESETVAGRNLIREAQSTCGRSKHEGSAFRRPLPLLVGRS